MSMTKRTSLVVPGLRGESSCGALKNEQEDYFLHYVRSIKMIYIVNIYGEIDDDDENKWLERWTFYGSQKEAEKVVKDWVYSGFGGPDSRGGVVYRIQTPRNKKGWMDLMNDPEATMRKAKEPMCMVL
jgi:hypothetical protein